MSKPHEAIEWPAGTVRSLHLSRPTWLRVLHGRLWVTHAHDPDDHFVSAGGALCLRPGHVVLEADAGTARYRLEPEHPARAWAFSLRRPARNAPRPGPTRPSHSF